MSLKTRQLPLLKVLFQERYYFLLVLLTIWLHKLNGFSRLFFCHLVFFKKRLSESILYKALDLSGKEKTPVGHNCHSAAGKKQTLATQVPPLELGRAGFSHCTQTLTQWQGSLLWCWHGVSCPPLLSSWLFLLFIGMFFSGLDININKVCLPPCPKCCGDRPRLSGMIERLPESRFPNGTCDYSHWQENLAFSISNFPCLGCRWSVALVWFVWCLLILLFLLFGYNYVPTHSASSASV